MISLTPAGLVMITDEAGRYDVVDDKDAKHAPFWA